MICRLICRRFAVSGNGYLKMLDMFQSEIHNPQSKGDAFGRWEQAGMALETTALLTNQFQRRQVEYRIIAINSAKISVPGNMVMTALRIRIFGRNQRKV